MDNRAVNFLTLPSQSVRWDRLQQDQRERTGMHQRPVLQIADYQEDIHHH